MNLIVPFQPPDRVRDAFRSEGCDVVNITQAVQLIEPSGVKYVAAKMAQLKTQRDIDAAIADELKRVRRNARLKGPLTTAEMRGVMLAAEAMLRKEINRRLKCR